jgi:hypothetical protein
MKMFRAVAKEGFDETKVYSRNVPYVVDNVWEWLRPDYYPSRRHAAYASSTPELALQNASSVGNNQADYIVCELTMNNKDVALAHIPVTDARLHKDIGKIQRHIASYLGKDFSNLSFKEKMEHAVLYLPSMSQHELNEYFIQHPILANDLKNISTFWQEAESSPQNHDGELFFELGTNNSYTLKKI